VLRKGLTHRALSSDGRVLRRQTIALFSPNRLIQPHGREEIKIQTRFPEREGETRCKKNRSKGGFKACSQKGRSCQKGHASEKSRPSEKSSSCKKGRASQESSPGQKGCPCEKSRSRQKSNSSPKSYSR